MKYESLNTEFPDTNEKLIDICREYSLYTWIPQKMAHPVPIKIAYGCWYEDFEGKKYFDLSSQLVCVNIGYGQKKVADAIKEQVDILPYVKPMDTHAARAVASLKSYEESASRTTVTGCPLKGVFYALFTGSPVNGSMYSFSDI